MTQTIAIVGGGLSGSLTAVHLMRRAASHDLRILLFNRSGRMARGLAYGTRSESHVLNVPAARMSVFADDPGHFLRYAQRQDPALEGGSFVRREVYGDYLEWTLRTAESEMAEPQRFEHVSAEVSDLDVGQRRSWLKTRDGERWPADRIVLALGNFAPAVPEVPGLALSHSPRYIGDPWVGGALDSIDPERPVLLLGTGLTMIDMALTLRARGCLRMHALSRRGLVPQAHREHGPAALAPALSLPDESQATPRLREWLSQLRKRCSDQAASGIDWRETIASLRQVTPQLWQRLDQRQRRQFLRHVQPYWEVHRHRLAPQSAQRLNALLAQDILRVHAGRILNAEAAKDGLSLRYRQRGKLDEHTLQLGSMVNCTGPNTRLESLGEPLLQSLLDRGLMTADALGLGIAVDDRLAMLQSDGHASRVLHYIGPFLRARYWECTAVPELRVHAERLAAGLAAVPDVALAA